MNNNTNIEHRFLFTPKNFSFILNKNNNNGNNNNTNMANDKQRIYNKNPKTNSPLDAFSEQKNVHCVAKNDIAILISGVDAGLYSFHFEYIF